jgi:hypothetical protein
MASRGAVIGTSAALAGLAGLGVAAVTLGATDSTTPLQPAADTIQTQTQIVRTVEHRTRRLKARKTEDGRTVVRAADAPAAPPVSQSTPAPATTAAPVAAPQSDDGPAHDVGDDHGGRVAEPGDDNGGATETGDDHGGSNETGDDHGGQDHSGRGGGSQDD